jgi:hypothetical protein
MVFVTVLPVGFLQLEAIFTGSYDAGRCLAFYRVSRASASGLDREGEARQKVKLTIYRTVDYRP